MCLSITVRVCVCVCVCGPLLAVVVSAVGLQGLVLRRYVTETEWCLVAQWQTLAPSCLIYECQCFFPRCTSEPVWFMNGVDRLCLHNRPCNVSSLREATAITPSTSPRFSRLLCASLSLSFSLSLSLSLSFHKFSIRLNRLMCSLPSLLPRRPARWNPLPLKHSSQSHLACPC